jgi:hypothetical protein
MRLPRRATLSVAALLLFPALLSACSGDDASENASENAAERAIEDATGGDADIDIDGEDVTIETSEGTFTSGQGLPDGFPSEVPLIEGEVQTGLSGSGTGSDGGFAVVVATDLDGEAAAEQAASLLTDAGYETSEGAGGGFGAGLFTNADWEVLVISTDTGDGAQVQYIVSAG